ncbi:hypothetical protein [uncultured Duncaniella sp.]|uniref:hypothetical protein n=1 Tax=uncultured Duncaniella sp. TaxID=2768039 RepID=UPI0026057430|nr:hypothetical protein [uncultured Duncaniella sp.]
MLLSDIFDARSGYGIPFPHTFAERNYALWASLRFRSMRGYHRIAAAQLPGCHPASREAALCHHLVGWQLASRY